MELKMPTAEQAHWGLRAMKTVALSDGALDDAERQMLTSVQTMLGPTMQSKISRPSRRRNWPQDSPTGKSGINWSKG